MGAGAKGESRASGATAPADAGEVGRSSRGTAAEGGGSGGAGREPSSEAGNPIGGLCCDVLWSWSSFQCSTHTVELSAHSSEKERSSKEVFKKTCWPFCCLKNQIC